jgi:hypothetical protein
VFEAASAQQWHQFGYRVIAAQTQGLTAAAVVFGLQLGCIQAQAAAIAEHSRQHTASVFPQIDQLIPPLAEAHTDLADVAP